MNYAEQRTETQKKIDEAVLERVKRGVAILEEKHGPFWYRKINLDTLDLSDISLCVLGQLYGGPGEPTGYYDGLRELGITGGVYGFDTQEESYRDLDEAWRAVISNGGRPPAA